MESANSEKPSLSRRVLQGILTWPTAIATVLTAFGLAYTQLNVVEDWLTKPLLHQVSVEKHLALPTATPSPGGVAQIEHQCQLYELRNPGPGTLRNIEINLFFDAPCDTEKQAFTSGDMHIESTDGELRFVYETNGADKTLVRGYPWMGSGVIEIPSGKSLMYKVMGPSRGEDWKLAKSHVRTSDATYVVDDVESRSGQWLVNTLRASPAFLLICSGPVFWTLFYFLEKRLRRELQQERASFQGELSEESLGNVQALRATTIDDAVRTMEVARDAVEVARQALESSGTLSKPKS